MTTTHDMKAVYANYARKLQQRYESYDYSKFPAAKEKYHLLLEHLKAHETKGTSAPPSLPPGR